MTNSEQSTSRRQWLRSAGLGVAAGASALLLGCNNSGPGGSAEATTKAAALKKPASFETWRDPSGLVIDKPASWQAQIQSPYRVAVFDAQAPVVAIRTAVLMKGANAADWLKAYFAKSETWIKSANLIDLKTQGAGLGFATFDLTDRNGIARRANATLVQNSGIGTLFIASAPADIFERELPKLAAILASMRYERPKAGQQPQQSSELSYVRWTDPFEGAFSTEIPQGWRADGGMRRIGPIGPRVIYTLSAPGNRAQIFAGDGVYAQRFIFPSQVVCSLNPCPGRMQNGDMIMNFMPAGQMAQQLIQQRFGQAQIVSVTERPDIIAYQRRNEPVMQGAASHISAADTVFRPGQGRIGLMFVKTSGQFVQNLGGGWYVTEVYGFVAEEAEAGRTARALGHLIGATRLNPQWFMGEMRLQQQMAQQYLDYLHGSQALQQRTINERWESDVQRQEGRRESLGSTVQLYDAERNERITVDNDSRYYFRNDGPTGTTVVGSQIDNNPDPVSLRRMLQMGKDVPYM